MSAIVTWQSDGTASVWNSISQALAQAINSAVKITDQGGNPIQVISIIPGQGIVPNGTPGSGYLANGCPLNVFFGGAWQPGQQDVLKALGITACLPVANPSGIPSMGVTQQGTVSSLAIGSGAPSTTSAATASQVAAAIAPSLTPGNPGSIPTGQVTGQTVFNAGGTVYRLIFFDAAHGVYQTGANNPGCSQVNTSPCDPQQFATLQDAVSYAVQYGQVPYLAKSVAEVWGIVAGTIQPNPAQIIQVAVDGSPVMSGGISPLMLAGAGVLVYFLFFRKKSA